MKKLIINADDFGQTKGITKAIIKAHKSGIVTSTTVIVNYPDFEDYTVKEINKNLDLSYGIHVNLVDGFALTGKSSLTNKRGEFLGLGKFVYKLYTFQIKTNDLEKEIEAQIIKLNSIVKISHADSHRHTHMMPGVFNTYLKVLKKNNVDKIRLPNETLFQKIKYESKFNSTFFTKLLVTFVSNISKKKIKKLNFKTTDKYLGMSLLGAKNNHLEMFKSILNKVENGTCEILCHPGYASEELNLISPQYNFERENELKTLTSKEIKNYLVKKKIKLINYNQL